MIDWEQPVFLLWSFTTTSFASLFEHIPTVEICPVDKIESVLRGTTSYSTPSTRCREETEPVWFNLTH